MNNKLSKKAIKLLNEYIAHFALDDAANGELDEETFFSEVEACSEYLKGDEYDEFLARSNRIFIQYKRLCELYNDFDKKKTVCEKAIESIVKYGADLWREHKPNNEACPLNDPETYCNPAIGGLPCSCGKNNG